MTVLPVPTGTAVDLEVAWLAADSGIAAFKVTPTAWARNRADSSKRLDLRIAQTVEHRISNGQVEQSHQFLLSVAWPFASAGGDLQNAQAYLHGLVEACLTRIRPSFGDASHGGRFLSVGEDDAGLSNITVDYDDPEVAQASGAEVLTARIRYGATLTLIVLGGSSGTSPAGYGEGGYGLGFYGGTAA